jgi:hypothetical protein
VLLLRRIKRLGMLSSADRRLLIRAYIWLGLIGLGLRVVGFQRLIVRMQRTAVAASSTVRPADALGQSRRYARWLHTAARFHPMRPRCLQCSLVLHRWLRQAGLPSELRVGVRKDGMELKAHAWVEPEGEVVNDWPESVAEFTPLAHPRAAPLGASVSGVW